MVDAFLKRISQMRAGRLPAFILAVGDDKKNDKLFNVSFWHTALLITKMIITNITIFVFLPV